MDISSADIDSQGNVNWSLSRENVTKICLSLLRNATIMAGGCLVFYMVDIVLARRGRSIRGW